MRRLSSYPPPTTKKSHLSSSPLIVILAILAGAASSQFLLSRMGPAEGDAFSLETGWAGKVAANHLPPGPFALANLSLTQQTSEISDSPLGGDIPPSRVIRDPYSVFSGIAVDTLNDEVVIADDNLSTLLVYSRTLMSEGIAEPARRIGGSKTKIDFICGVAIDPLSREIYTVNNDTQDNLLVFSHEQNGDAAPSRELKVDHGAWGVALDGDHNEVAITIQHINKISIYRKTAVGDEKPLRVIQGPTTGLADPHGIFIESKNNEIFVTNHGSWHLVETGVSQSTEDWFSRLEIPSLIPSRARFEAPSIRVYSRTANGDIAPLRTIQGPKTKLNLPLGIYVDRERNEIAVANDGGNSVLVFDRTAHGDVAPVRTIAGPATGLKNPAGVFIDTKNDEIWVSNWGNHSATVYPRTAKGNVAPLRTIRSAPRDAPLPGLGNPGAVAYDPKRDQLLVPN